ncbi:ATP-binding protein [Catellatospora paridis]|uniref:ATP-binding protein n=1 Tax=Catellatospora paridis TaxID=1617086 RepID=UPI0012D3FDBA|nr:ATP-binding protein [Catellatospora paridis]
MVDWLDEVPTDGSVELPPDRRALDGLGRNHSLETALADLVDNSYDAGASHVLIRFVRTSGRLRSLYVIDNGKGIASSAVDQAMTLGGRREYGASDLGHFGLGLKVASFSQAGALTLLTAAAGDVATGRRWRVDDDRHGFHCDTVPADFAAAELTRDRGIPSAGSGTIVRWDDVTAFPTTEDLTRIETFISRSVTAIRNHLGLVFHRLLTAEAIEIGVDVEDVDLGVVGSRFTVVPLDPFGYRASGRSGYPKTLTATEGTSGLEFRCHVWPGRSDMIQFKLPGGAERRQGLYFYRRGRLLQAGGEWHGLHPQDRRLQLARVAIDIDDDVVGLFRMNPEKSRVVVGPEFGRIAESAAAEDGTNFGRYLADAEQSFTESRQRSRTRAKMIPPGKGFDPALKRAIEDEIPLRTDEAPISVKWRRFDDDTFFDIDREQRTLWLNDLYRPDPIGERRSVNDAPLVKALMYLLAESLFQGEYLGVRDKDNLDLWQEVLTIAALSERR